jgi:hypothetical protein
MTLPPPEVIVAAPPPSIAHANAPPLPSSTLFVNVALGRRTERRHEDARGRARRSDVLGERRVRHGQRAVGVEDAAAVPRRRGVAAERAVDDVASPSERRPPATSPPTLPLIVLRRDVDGAVEEPVDAAAGLVDRGVVADRAVGQVQRGALGVVDAAAAEVEARRAGAVLGVVGDDTRSRLSVAEVEDAATLRRGDAVADDEVVDATTSARRRLGAPARRPPALIVSRGCRRGIDVTSSSIVS